MYTCTLCMSQYMYSVHVHMYVQYNVHVHASCTCTYCLYPCVLHTYTVLYIHHIVIVQDRAGTNSPLDFEVVGGSEYSSDIFVASVKGDSMPEKAGLMVGDQVSVRGEE